MLNCRDVKNEINTYRCFGYTDKQEAIRQKIRKFAENEVSPGALHRDKTGEFDYQLYRRLADMGVTKMRFPESYGGSDEDFLSWCIVYQEIARVDLSLAMTLHVAIAGPQRILALATKEQIEAWKNKWILPVIQGEATASTAITETEAGSNTSNIQTTGVLHDGNWVINGNKTWVTGLGLETTLYAVTLVLTDNENKQFDYIVVPTNTKGCKIGNRYQTLGLRTAGIASPSLNNCYVPSDNLIGRSGEGYKWTTRQRLIESRVQLCSGCLGVHEACLEESVKFAQRRMTFGQPISRYQHIQGMLIDMVLNLDLGQCYRDKVASLIDQKIRPLKESSMLKIFCTEAAKRAADNAIQIHGAQGLFDENSVCRFYRDVRAMSIAEGPTELQKSIVARDFGW